MIIFLSGEGPTDFGICDPTATSCNGRNFKFGPMAVIIDQIIVEKFHFSPLSCDCMYLIPRSALSKFKNPKPTKPRLLSGIKKPKGANYFQANAQAFAQAIRFLLKELAKDAPINENDCIAILYRDNDGSLSTPATELHTKIQSIDRGFKIERFHRGISMIPKPTGEAWILCGINKLTSDESKKLESRSPNPTSNHPLKDELGKSIRLKIGSHFTANRESLASLFIEQHIHFKDIKSPSFFFFLQQFDNLVGGQPSSN